VNCSRLLLLVSASSILPDIVSLCLILIAKKPTRQWAAWTRQEEENFFNALRQVGKVRSIHYGYNALLLFTI